MEVNNIGAVGFQGIFSKKNKEVPQEAKTTQEDAGKLTGALDALGAQGAANVKPAKNPADDVLPTKTIGGVGKKAEIEYFADGEYTKTLPNGTVETYYANGQIAQRITKKGEETTWYPNGNMEFHSKGGKEEYWNEDGSPYVL